VPAPTPRQRENFLAEAVGPRERKITYMDRFRFGFGFMVAWLLVLLVLGGASWAIVTLLKLH